MFSNDFVINNYLHEKQVVALISLGVPCGAIQAVYNGKDLSHREEHQLSDKQLEKMRQIYVPINSIDELVKHRASHFCSYTINPNYIEPKKVRSFMYRFELLTDRGMRMFDTKEINKHQFELLEQSPITYEKVEQMKDKYITPEVQKKYVEENKPRGLRENGFYEWLNADAYKEAYFAEEEEEEF